MFNPTFPSSLRSALPAPLPALTLPSYSARLAVALAISTAVHALVIITLEPAVVVYRPSLPLSVEIRAAEKPEITFRLSTPQGPGSAAPEPQVAKVAPQQHPPSAGAETGSEPLIKAPLPQLDRYYRSDELDVRAVPINEVMLVYPKRAYEMRISGRVILRALINERGDMDKVDVLDATPRGVFEEAALEAAGAVKYSPALKNGQPVKSQKIIEVAFDPYESITVP